MYDQFFMHDNLVRYNSYSCLKLAKHVFTHFQLVIVIATNKKFMQSTSFTDQISPFHQDGPCSNFGGVPTQEYHVASNIDL